MKNFNQFHKKLKPHYPDQDVPQTEVQEAFRNLSGFMSLLVKINEREKIIPLEHNEGQSHEDQ